MPSNSTQKRPNADRGFHTASANTFYAAPQVLDCCAQRPDHVGVPQSNADASNALQLQRDIGHDGRR